MANAIKYFIDGKEHETPSAKLTVAELLQQAGYSATEFLLISPNQAELADPDELIEIHDQDRFQTKPREEGGLIHYKVNGEELKSTSSQLTVADILRAAGKPASVNVNDLSSYFLEDMENGQKYDNLEDVVPLRDGSAFLAVHRGRTPVA